jgi:hypothetical protein
MSAATADASARRGALVPVVERGCRARHWMRTRVRGWRGTLLHSEGKKGSRYGAKDWDGGGTGKGPYGSKDATKG